MAGVENRREEQEGVNSGTNRHSQRRQQKLGEWRPCCNSRSPRAIEEIRAGRYEAPVLLILYRRVLWSSLTEYVLGRARQAAAWFSLARSFLPIWHR
eukprot:6209039-Pleurochrysis_carterae.AAC.2